MTPVYVIENPNEVRAKQPHHCVIVSEAISLLCHCEERSDEAISLCVPYEIAMRPSGARNDLSLRHCEERSDEAISFCSSLMTLPRPPFGGLAMTVLCVIARSPPLADDEAIS
jgi:hypothetical protein